MQKRNIVILFCLLLFPVIILSCEPLIVPIDYVPETVIQETIDHTLFQTTSETQATALPATETVPAESAKAPERRVVSFIGAGDNIVYYGNVRDAASLAEKDGRKYNFKPTYSSVSDMISAADIAFINQETLMCGDGYAFSYYPTFNGPQDMVYDLAELGFDIVNIANNHMLDKGEKGLSRTIDFWRSVEGITLIGGYKTHDEYLQPHFVEKNGVTIAFLSYTFMTNSLSLPENSPMVVPYPVKADIQKQVAEARQNADCVMVSVHWGEENVFTPNDEQREFAAYLTGLDVDVIIGHHPHVIQPIEWMKNPETGHDTLCIFSLGNFVAEMSNDYNMLGGLISFQIVKTDNVVSIEEVRFYPTVYYFDIKFYHNHVYYYEDLTEELVSSHGLRYYGKVLNSSKLRQYLQTIDSAFLADHK